MSFTKKYPDLEKNNDGYVAMKLNEAFCEKMKNIAAQREKEQVARPESTPNKDQTKRIVSDGYKRRRSSVMEGHGSIATKITKLLRDSKVTPLSKSPCT